MKKKDKTCLQEPFCVWKQAVSYIQEASGSRAEPKKVLETMKHHHHFTIDWKTSLLAKNILDNTSDNKKNSHLALDFPFILSLLYLTCPITVSSVLYAELLFIICYFTVAESEIETSAQVNKKIM